MFLCNANKHFQDFSKATQPVSFSVHVRVFVGRANVHGRDICLDNGQTNERLVIKTIDIQFYPYKVVLISRYPTGANQEWIEANEQEIVGWEFRTQNRRIQFERSLGGINW
jgi:hypothetical protein